MGNVSDYFKEVTDGGYDTSEEDDMVMHPKTATSASLASSRLGRAIRPTLDMAVTAGDAATLGLSRIAGGAVGAASSLKAGDSPVEGFTKGVSETHKAFEESRNRLPGPLGFLAEIFGGAKGIPGQVDKAIDSGIAGVGARKFAPTWKDRGANYLATYAAGIPVATADRYMRGDQDFDDAVKGGMLDSLIGVGAQGLLGDGLIPVGQRLYRNLKGNTALGDAVQNITGGELSRGMTLSQVYNFANEMDIPADQGILDAVIDNQPRSETARRFYNAVADMSFPDPNSRKINTAAARQARAKYDETVQEVNDAAQRANKEAVSEISAVLGEPSSRVPRAKSPEQEAAARALADIGSTIPATKGGPLPIGATKINTRGFIQEAQEDYEKALGMNLIDMGEDKVKVWGKFKDLLRGQEQEVVAKGVRKIESKGKGAPNSDLVFGDVPLARLYEARKSLADMLTPQGRLSNDPLTRSQRKYVMTLINKLDDKVDEVAEGEFGLARGAFAKEMQIKEAEEYGQTFYRQRSSNVENPSDYSAHYGETLDDFLSGADPRVREAFADGFKKAMVDLTGERSLLGELQNFVGDLDSGNVLKAKMQGVEHLETVLGKEDTDRLLKVYTEGNHLIEFRTRLAKLFEVKSAATEYKPDAIHSKMTPADFLGANAENSIIFATLAKLRKQIKPSDAKRLNAVELLLTAKGDDLAKLLKKGVSEASPGGGAQVGATAASVASGSSLDTDEAEEDYDLFDELGYTGDE